MTDWDDAPPFALFSSPYSGSGLKTKSFVSAKHRIAGLLADAEDVELEINACLRGRYASAFLKVILPHGQATPAYMADYETVNEKLGMKMPLMGYLVSAPTPGGGRTRLRRIAPP